MCVRRSRKARGVGTRARHKLSEYVLWLCGRYPLNLPKGFPEGLHPPGFPMGYTPLNSPRGFPEGLYPLEFPRACTLLNSPRSSPRAVLPVSSTLRCGLRGRLCRLRDASRHQGYNRSFSVLGAPRRRGATARGGLFGLRPQPEGPPTPFFLWGAPRHQGATPHHHVHRSPCRRPCRLQAGSHGHFLLWVRYLSAISRGGCFATAPRGP